MMKNRCITDFRLQIRIAIPDYKVKNTKTFFRSWVEPEVAFFQFSSSFSSILAPVGHFLTLS